jgi:oligopeptide/dipeptide ABC transporter ATP-binding protein
MSQALIQVRKLRKAFPITKGLFLPKRIGEIAAIDNVSFDIFQGETLGCVGGSGSGKSTLGRLILNLIPPDSGEVMLDGATISNLSAKKMHPYRRDLQMIFQDPLQSLNPRRTVTENVARPLLNFGVPKEKAFGRVQEIFEVVGLDPGHINRYPHEFSGGQCQRIGIARALVSNPRFIFLDEPVSALDVSIQAQILNLLEDLQEKFNLTYLFVANDLKVVKHISDRIMILYQGLIVELGPSESVYGDPLHPFTRVFLEAVLRMGGGDSWQQAAMRSERLGALAREDATAAAAAERLGCIYSSACSDRADLCKTSSPELQEIQPGHYAACHRPNRS